MYVENQGWKAFSLQGLIRKVLNQCLSDDQHDTNKLSNVIKIGRSGDTNKNVKVEATHHDCWSLKMNEASGVHKHNLQKREGIKVHMTFLS